MSGKDHAEVWRDALKRAGQLNPNHITAVIVSQSDNGLRAQRFDAQGGRTAFVPCDDPDHCDDGPLEHSHMASADPTGNAAVRGGRSDHSGQQDKRDLDLAQMAFVTAANRVLWWVCGETATSWAGVVRLNAKLMPGTVQAGLDVDDERTLPRTIDKVAASVATVARIAKEYLPHAPSTDDQHWTAGLGPNDVCQWHRELHERYRRPRLSGKNICGDCLQLAELLGQKPPRWLLEAEVDLRESRPLAWRAALSRCMDELGIVRSA